MRAVAMSLVVATATLAGGATDAVGGQRGGDQPASPFRAGARFVPDPTPPPPPNPTGPRSIGPVPIPSPFGTPAFRGHRWLWPLMFYGGIGLPYFGDETFGAFTAPPTAFAPGEAPMGGLQLDVEPRRAAVYLDGEHIGTVDDFSGFYHHLALTSGPHRIVILTHGYDPLTFDVVISPGRTITYRGTLTRTPGQ